jgi:hypothetical protein
LEVGRERQKVELDIFATAALLPSAVDTRLSSLGPPSLSVLVNHLTPAISPGIHSSFVHQLNELIRLRVFPYGAVDWSTDTVRTMLGAMEVGFGVMVLVPRLTVLADFFLGQLRNRLKVPALE